jgi:hypothetical protein
MMFAPKTSYGWLINMSSETIIMARPTFSGNATLCLSSLANSHKSLIHPHTVNCSSFLGLRTNSGRTELGDKVTSILMQPLSLFISLQRYAEKEWGIRRRDR